MDKNAAKQLVRETFQNPFDKDRFYRLVKELLNHFEDAPFIYRGNYIPDAYDPFINTLERIGKYKDPEGNKIDILIANLKKTSSLEHARTMQRNFISWYLAGSRGGELKDAALVAFVAPDPEDWRFSFVKMEYKIAETPGGKVKAKEEFTPAKRYSFLVGKHETSHTAQSRLVPILEDDAHNPTLDYLEDAFNIEKVTKEFFEKYRELYLGIKDAIDCLIKKDTAIKKDFEAKAVNTVDFSKKLLGQIVFLYFLQKKGWFGVKRGQNWGSGSKHFLRELFEKKHSDYKNFFNDILEPLFYEALRVERPDDYYSHFDCRIPFLNGGLFDPINNYDWIETDIILSNDLFSNSLKTKEGDTGTGILDMFDRYNFTVKEDEPLEKEVAVDPEMLGKVFENLLEVKDRKSKGTYYTPREIVHYMCQESLINYLNAEFEGKVKKEDIEKLIRFGETVIEHDAKVKINGRETKTYSYKLPKSIRDNAKAIDEKLASIRICDPAVGSGAFPVGMMSEIIRTRNALSIYVKDGEPRSLYDFKRHAIRNSLYGVDIDPGAVEIAKLRLWLSLVVDEEDIKQIKPLPNLDYKIMRGNSLLGIEKEKMGVRNMFYELLMTELKEKKQLYFNETSAKKKQEYKIKIDELINQITSGHKDFDFEVYFSEVFREKKGFDVVIANPPYVFTRGANFSKSFKNEIKNKYKVGGGKINLFSIFIEQGTSILKNGGILIYIVPNTIFRVTSYKNLRQFLVENTAIKQIVDLKKGVFENVTASTTIIEIQNSRKKDNSVEIIDSIDDLRLTKISRNISQKSFVNPEFVFSIFIGEGHQSLFRKLFEKSKKLQDITKDIVDGIVTPKGKNKFISNRKVDERYKPFLEGKDIDAYTIRNRGRFILFDRELLHRPRADYVWETNEKLLIRRIGGGSRALYVAYDNNHFYTFASINNLLMKDDTGFDIRYILALLNSKLLNWYYVENFTNRSELTVNISKTYLDQLPIKIPTPKAQKVIVDTVNKIITITEDKDYLANSTKQAKVHDLEKQIDQLVYKLYGLTSEEVKIVEN